MLLTQDREMANYRQAMVRNGVMTPSLHSTIAKKEDVR